MKSENKSLLIHDTDVKAYCLACLQGLDLSPYFLAVAKFKELKSSPRKNPISWKHAKGEDTSLPSQSFDIVSISYVVCFVLEAYAILTMKLRTVL